MAVDLRGRNLLSMKDLTGEEIEAILARAAELKADRAKVFREAPLAGKTLAMIFQKPSLRTRVSFEAGMTNLGGHAIYLAPSDIKLGQRETTEDIALVLSRYADVIMARVFGHNIVEDLAKYATVPVINGLSDFEHPCQILADLLTIKERKGKLRGLSATYIGDGNNVAHSLMYGAALVGMSMTITTPPGFEPSEKVLKESQEIGGKTGARVRVVNDIKEGVAGTDVLYTDVWASMGQEDQAAERRNKFEGYQINCELLSLANKGAVILHCLPAHYGEEIDYEASRTPNSAIFDQAENRMHAQNGLLVMVARG
ncbi:MAG: ornithine carbamoyltransferase [Phycisphaerae bacterium]|jgi:ornithine carbamoyltransferase